MLDTAHLSEAKRALLQKYLRGDLSPAAMRARAIPRRAPDAPVPLSSGQQQLWFLTQLAPDVPFYNEPITVRLPSPLDIDALERSYNEIVRRHETWRTTFSVSAADGQPLQVIHDYVPTALPVADLRALPEAEREATALRLAEEDARRPFDLTRGPLVRPALIRLSDADSRLFVTLHHIIMDGVTVCAFVAELAALYRAFACGKLSPLPELPIQYGDYACWQRQALDDALLAEQLAYWRERLGDDAPAVELPTDRPRPAVQTFRGSQQQLALPRGLTDALKALSRREGVTLFMTLLAAFKTLLHRATGQVDIIVGTATAGRKRAELERMLGYFINPVALRTDLSGNPTFREVLRRVREVTLGAYSHDDVPFDQLVRELQPKRDLSRNPLIGVVCNMEPPLPPLDPGWAVSQMDVDTGAAKRDLYLELDDRPEGVIGRVQYSTDLFDRSTIDRLIRQYQWLLEQIVEAPERAIGEYSLVAPAERALLPDPSLPLDAPDYPLTADMVAGWVERTPEAVAVRQGDSSWSYAALGARVEDLARALPAAGLAAGDVAAISGPRSFGLVAGTLAVLRAGGVLLPIDPQLPVQRQRLMLREGGARLLIQVSDQQTPDPAMEQQAEMVGVRLQVDPWTARMAGATQPHAGTPPAWPAIAPADPAYIFFTSGSTGVPKAVLGTHAGLSHFLCWQRETFAVGPGDRGPQLIGLSFDAVLRDVFLPLTSGATLCLPPRAEDLSPDRVLRWLAEEQITLLHTVPTLAQTWLAVGDAGARLSALRWAFFAGEPLTEQLVARWRAVAPATARIVNFYGPTETTMIKCAYVVPDEPVPGVQPVGRTLPQTQALVLTAQGQLCGIGEAGEVVLRTPFRTRGYLNAPAEAWRFRQNPLRDDPSDLLYYTGDRGRYRADGSLEVLGRLDQQVKIRGVRVEPEEVAATVRLHPAVEEAVVVAREDHAGDPRLVAYVVPRGAHIPESADLRRFVQEHLPVSMTPSAFMPLDKLPLTPNGKLDRRALPAPEEGRLQAGYAAPRTPIEETLAGIWADVLRVERAGIHDDFFALGGHSLLAIQVLAKLRGAFAVDIPLRALFEQPTVAALARHIELARWARGAAPDAADSDREEVIL